MVAAANPLAAQAGAAILRAGGTAMDAAVAVQMVLNVVEPQSSGIGGGAFVVHWDARRQRVETYDGRETAPAAATPQLFLDARGAPLSFAAAQIGGRSVGTPGVLRALELAHRDHGRLPWARAVLARDRDCGARASPSRPGCIPLSPARRRRSARIPPPRALFLGPDGAPKPVGTLLANPELAATLRAVAGGGADAFYAGRDRPGRRRRRCARTRRTRAGCRDAGPRGLPRRQARPPVCGGYRGKTICGMGMPSSGTVTLLMTLAMLERHDWRALGAGSVAGRSSHRGGLSARVCGPRPLHGRQRLRRRPRGRPARSRLPRAARRAHRRRAVDGRARRRAARPGAARRARAADGLHAGRPARRTCPSSTAGATRCR